MRITAFCFAITCACHTIAIDITLIVKMHNAMTNPICVSEAGTRNIRRNHAIDRSPVVETLGRQMAGPSDVGGMSNPCSRAKAQV